jgi:phosphohistidine phosphatase
MRLTLLRHGPAVDREEWTEPDPERPLTKEGINATTELVEAARSVIKASEIWTSPWVRARQTAEIASSIWKLPLRETEWLAGGATTAHERASRLHHQTDVVLVGHEPDFSEFVRFLCGAQIELKKAGLVLMKGMPRQGEMVLRGLYVPKHVEKLRAR